MMKERARQFVSNRDVVTMRVAHDSLSQPIVGVRKQNTTAALLFHNQLKTRGGDYDTTT